MAGMTIDPNSRCRSAQIRLMAQLVGGVVIGGAINKWTTKFGTIDGLQVFGVRLTAVIIGLETIFGRYLKNHLLGMGPTRYILSFPEAIRSLWSDCNIGGGLKRRLEQFKATASEVVGKGLPAPAPIPVSISDQFTAMDLPIEWGQRTAVTPGTMLTHGGTGMLDQVMWGIAGAATLIYGGIVLTSALAAATPAAAPALAGAVAL